MKLPSQTLLRQAMGDLEPWAHRCHAASLHLIRSGAIPAEWKPRVARGVCSGVQGQHSWVVLGGDCYAPDAPIIDPTLWSYDPGVRGLWVGSMADGRHEPHGRGSIWSWGKPRAQSTDFVRLAAGAKARLSEDARDFLKLLGPLDRVGWQTLASRAPVEGWPAGEILAAMADTPALRALVPIDRLGMLTDRNPRNLYW